MTIASDGLKGVGVEGLAAVICGALLSCGGPFSPGEGPNLVVTPPTASCGGIYDIPSARRLTTHAG